MDSNGSSRTHLEREILKVQKKLRDGEKLQERKDAGETLDKLQYKKLDEVAELTRKLEELNEKRAVEVEEVAAQKAKQAQEEERREEAKAAASTPQRVRFDATCLVGDWQDNCGSRIIVKPGDTRKVRRNKWVTYSYVANLITDSSTGLREKRLTIVYDQELQEWRCGNSVLVRESSSAAAEMTWRSSAGRVTIWTRTPGDGPVYFDGPVLDAYSYLDPLSGASWTEDYYCGWAPSGQGQTEDYFNTWMGGFDSHGASAGASVSESYGNGALEGFGASGSSGRGSGSFARSEPVLEEITSGCGLGCRQPIPEEDSLEESLQHEVTPVEEPVVVKHLENMCISNDRIDWAVPNKWGELSRLAVDAHVVSPPFDIQGSKDITLEFYPNGRRTTEPGCCTLQLSRGQGSVGGIKFELAVNLRSNGPKAILGRRFLADYPKPFGDSVDSESEAVTISLQVLGVF